MRRGIHLWGLNISVSILQIWNSIQDGHEKEEHWIQNFFASLVPGFRWVLEIDCDFVNSLPLTLKLPFLLRCTCWLPLVGLDLSWLWIYFQIKIFFYPRYLMSLFVKANATYSVLISLSYSLTAVLGVAAIVLRYWKEDECFYNFVSQTINWSFHQWSFPVLN